MTTQPYVGLRAFNREESAIFFGREEHTDALLDALTRQQFLAVVGLSGSGKSSLVKCGLIPALEAGYLSGAGTHWHIADFRPGNDPFKNLADALHQQAGLPAGLDDTLRHGGAFSLHEYLAAHPLPKSGKLLLICDQFEELLRDREQHANTQAAAFVALLLASSRAHTLADGQSLNGIYLVLTMRSDFLGECAQFVGLAEAINQGLYLTPRLNREQLRLAIEEPALIAGGEVEPALVVQLLEDVGNNPDCLGKSTYARCGVQLLEDVGNNPDQLPLLQHVLMRLWDEGQDLSLSHYQTLGGLSAALDKHAEEALSELNPQQQAIAEILFRALTERNREGKDTRRPLNAHVILELITSALPATVRPEPVEGQDSAHENSPSTSSGRTDDWEALLQVIDTFRQAGRNFLMPPPDVAITPDTMLDISHESLIRQWVRLQVWVADEADQAAMYQRLGDAAERHQAGKGEWWHGSDLALALDWQRTAQPTPAWASRYGEPAHFFLAMQFLHDSQTESQRLAAEKEARRKAELKQARQQRRWALVVVFITVSLAVWAMFERDHAQKEAARANKEAARANAAEELAINASFELDMLNIPAGQFVMGCSDGRDSDCRDGEKPAHRVSINRFQLGKYEVTQGQWRVIMGDNPSHFKDCGSNCPVENVSWEKVQTFIQKLNAKTGQHYRLPSEAEWEYACRAGQDTHYCGGNDVNAVAWYSGGKTHPVGGKSRNAFGLYDMSGNVWEWVQDHYHDNYTGAPTDDKAWQEDAPVGRVLRGGSWLNLFARDSRAANRNSNSPTIQFDNVGFRLARTPQ